MGKVIGPFDADDWFTMSQLKLDLEFIRKKAKDKPDYQIAEKNTAKLLQQYMTRSAA